MPGAKSAAFSLAWRAIPRSEVACLTRRRLFFISPLSSASVAANMQTLKRFQESLRRRVSASIRFTYSSRKGHPPSREPERQVGEPVSSMRPGCSTPARGRNRERMQTPDWPAPRWVCGPARGRHVAHRNAEIALDATWPRRRALRKLARPDAIGPICKRRKVPAVGRQQAAHRTHHGGTALFRMSWVRNNRLRRIAASSSAAVVRCRS